MSPLNAPEDSGRTSCATRTSLSACWRCRRVLRKGRRTTRSPATSFGVSLLPMRILLGTVTSSEEPGRMSTPARSRVSGAAGDTRSSSSRRNARRSSTTSAARRRLPSTSGSAAARVRHGSVRGARAEVPPGLQRGRATRVRRSERGCASRAAAGRSRVHQPRADGRARRSGQRRALSRQGTRLRARGPTARAPRVGRVGEGNSCARGRDLRWLRAHSRSARRRGWPR